MFLPHFLSTPPTNLIIRIMITALKIWNNSVLIFFNAGFTTGICLCNTRDIFFKLRIEHQINHFLAFLIWNWLHYAYCNVISPSTYLLTFSTNKILILVFNLPKWFKKKTLQPLVSVIWMCFWNEKCFDILFHDLIFHTIKHFSLYEKD